MISSIELENVRIFEGGGWRFPLPPLTVFCGTNSSGKSTLLRSLLLLKQSQGNSEIDRSTNGRLRFLGNQVDLGNYESFVSNNEKHREIALSITVDDRLPASYLATLRGVMKLKERPQPLSRIERATWLPYQLKCEFTFSLSTQGKPKLGVPVEFVDTTALTPSSASRGLLKCAQFTLYAEQEDLITWQVISSTAQSEKNIPRYEILIPRLYLEYWRHELGAAPIDIGKKKNDKYVRVHTELRGLLPHLLRVKFVREPDKNRSSRLSNWPLPDVIEFALDDVRTALQKLNYLGPLRAPAERYYIAHPDASPGLDAAGEFLPFILREMKEISVVPGMLLKSSGPFEKQTLAKALNAWLYYLRTGEHDEKAYKEIDSSTTKDVLVELLLKDTAGNRLHSLADSGFGYSQVVPIVVRGLLSEPGSTFIVEQPEVHLNPALQVRLAEFFIAMSRSGRQVLLETHSEHIVNAIRVHAAEDDSGEIASKCGIFFLDVQEGRPVLHKLNIKPDGTVPGWPTAFFGEAIALTSRLLRAQSRGGKDKSRR